LNDFPDAGKSVSFPLKTLFPVFKLRSTLHPLKPNLINLSFIGGGYNKVNKVPGWVGQALLLRFGEFGI